MLTLTPDSGLPPDSFASLRRGSRNIRRDNAIMLFVEMGRERDIKVVCVIKIV